VERGRRAKEEAEEIEKRSREEQKRRASKVREEEGARQKEREAMKESRREGREREGVKKRQEQEMEAKMQLSKASVDTAVKLEGTPVIVSNQKVIEGERKPVDVEEQKRLNKQAVHRVAGWLSSSPTSSKKVGSAAEVVGSTSTASEGPRTGAALVGLGPPPSNGGDKVEKCTLNRKEDKQDTTPTLSPDLRALLDGTDHRPTPKQGTAIQKHAGSRRFSGDAMRVKDVPAGPTNVSVPGIKRTSNPLKHDVPSADSRGIPYKRKGSGKTGARNEKEKAPSKDASGDMETAKDEKRYDSRSARGGRGGRVASVASMWASIADGTDGSQMKRDDVPVLTLKPTALRSGVAGSCALDFSKGRPEASKKPKIKDIFPGPPPPPSSPLIVNDRIKGPPLKTKRAAHFVNTTIPKPVFVIPSPPSITSASIELVGGPQQLSLEKSSPSQHREEGRPQQSRRVTPYLIAKEDANMKFGLDLSTLDASALPMNGRGTTKAIGREKLADLRSMWGG
jgi:hypothetical protein